MYADEDELAMTEEWIERKGGKLTDDGRYVFE